MLKRQNNNLINDDNNNDSHTNFMDQVFNKPYSNMKCKCTTTNKIGQIIKSLKQKTHIGMMRCPLRP